MRNLFFVFCCLTTTLYAQTAPCYTVAQTTYIPDTTSQTTQTIAQVADDQWSQVIPIGFTFCYYGAQYDSLLVGTNGAVTFNISLTGAYCPWPIPATNAPSGTFGWNGIMGPWLDLHPLTPVEVIFCWTSGVAPNRTFTVKYDSLSMHGCPSVFYSGRIILHESSNVIEVQIDYKYACSWNSGRSILGIQNQNGTQAVVVPGRNALNSGWTATQEAWIFTPTCNVCQPIGITEVEIPEQILVYPNPSFGAITIDATNSAQLLNYVELVDVSGRIVETKSFAQNNQLIQLDIETSGIYFVQAFDQWGEMISTTKVVVE